MKIPALNDSKEIGMCIYNVVVLSVVTLVLSLALKDNVTMKFATVSLFMIIGTTMTQCLIFVPKVSQNEEPVADPGAYPASALPKGPDSFFLTYKFNET